MIFRAYALHCNIIINFSIAARSASVCGGIIVLVVWTYGAILAIVVGIGGRTVLALPVENVVDLLIRADLAFQFSKVPILRMLALHTLLQIPEQILSLIAPAFLQRIVVHTAVSAVFADSIFLILSQWAERTIAIRQNIL